MLPLDQQLWRLLHNDISVRSLAQEFLLIALGIAVVIWVIVDRRSRSIWRKTRGPKVIVGDGGPYRETVFGTFLQKAPLNIQLTSFCGIVVGVVGMVWPVVFIADVSGGFDETPLALLFEAVGMVSALLSIISAVALLRGNRFFAKREAWMLRITAFLLTGLCGVYLAHGFDAMPVNVYGIKWHETMPLGKFLVSGFIGITGGHTGYTWRVLLRSCSIFGLMSAGYFMLLANVVSRQQQEQQQDKEQEGDEPDGASPSSVLSES